MIGPCPRSLLAAAAVLAAAPRLDAAQEKSEPRFAALVFSKTTGYRHASIEPGIAAIKALGAEHGFRVDATEDGAQFSDATLSRYKVVVFLSTSGDVLDDAQKGALQRYIRGGGGFVGIHSASDTEYGWAWYGRLVGAWFGNHPEIQKAAIRIVDPDHPSTRALPPVWQRTDEWYSFRVNPRPGVHVLAVLDESSYTGGTMGSDHPIAWCRELEGGRSWYTGLGHTEESYAEPLFRRHLLGGIMTAAGVEAADCSAERKE